MKRVGIYGGSFNPIHRGHTTLGTTLCQMEAVDELWFLVSPQNPLKAASDLLPDADRLRLARLAVEDSPHLQVSDFEMHLPRPSYMVHTLEALRAAQPDCEFILVIGADNWLSFHHWFRPEEIRRHHRILVFPRPEYALETEKLPTGVTAVSTPLIDVSSTAIRHAIAAGSYAGEDLHPAVWADIRRHGFYTSSSPTHS